MEYVKVVGETHAEALKKLRDTYGAEAIIYSEKEIAASSFLGRVVGKKEFQIMAAITEKKKDSGSMRRKIQDVESMLSRPAESGRPVVRRVLEAPAALAENGHLKPSASSHQGNEFLKKLDADSFLREIRDKTLQEKKLPVAESESNGELSLIKKEIEMIRESLASLAQQATPFRQEKEFQALYQVLLQQDFSEAWAREFVDEVKKTLPQNEWSIRKKVYQKAFDRLTLHIKTNAQLGSRRVVVLLGPTGVGKTTTLAKLAARLKLKENKKLSLITLDNFRIAATEQLKVYGNILDVKVHVFKDAQRFQQHVLSDPADIILVDTTGISHTNRSSLEKQTDFFAGLENETEKHLVISATSKPEDARNILENFDVFHIDKIILSKIDETSRLGAFVELLENWNRPFSFVTNGQGVPDDYRDADRNHLAELILRKFADEPANS